MTRTLLQFFVALSVLVFASVERPARAASFQVNPVNLTLSADATNKMLSIRNQGDESVRVQASILNWSQRDTGDMDLTPTSDIVFFPSILTIAPHEVRNLRVAVASGAVMSSAVVERNYRLIVEELLPVQKESTANAVRVITRMSIPIFVQTAPGKPVPRIEGLAVHEHTAHFLLTNPGPTHFVAHKIRLFVTGSDGHVLLDQSIAGWYVLAQGTRVYNLALPETACSTGATVTVEVETDHGSASARINSSCSH